MTKHEILKQLKREVTRLSEEKTNLTVMAITDALKAGDDSFDKGIRELSEQITKGPGKERLATITSLLLTDLIIKYVEVS